MAMLSLTLTFNRDHNLDLNHYLRDHLNRYLNHHLNLILPLASHLANAQLVRFAMDRIEPPIKRLYRCRRASLEAGQGRPRQG